MSDRPSETLSKIGVRYFACHTKGKGWNVLDSLTNKIVFPNRVFSRIGAEDWAKSQNNKAKQESDK